MVNGTSTEQEVGKESSENHKRKGWLLQSQVQRGASWSFHKMRSIDSTGEKHIVLCIHFQYPAPKVSQAGDLGGTRLTLRVPDLGQLQTSPSSGSSSDCLMLCLFQYTYISFTLFQPWNIEFPGSTEKGDFSTKSPFFVRPTNTSPREWCEFWGEAQFGLSCCFYQENFLLG